MNILQTQILQYCNKAVIMAVKEPIPFGDEVLELDAIFDAKLGKTWPSKLKRKIKVVHKIVVNDIREGKIDPMMSENPVRFIINSVAIHVLELMLVKAGITPSLVELRSEGYHEALHTCVTSLDLA